jgi:hypothetical protein
MAQSINQGELTMTPEVKSVLEDLKAHILLIEKKIEDLKAHVINLEQDKQDEKEDV